MAPEIIAEVLRADLGGEPGALSDSFEARPFAAASIGQVHRAVFNHSAAGKAGGGASTTVHHTVTLAAISTEKYVETRVVPRAKGATTDLLLDEGDL